MKKIFVIILCLSSFLTGCINLSTEKKMVFGLLPDESSIPFLIAEKKGFFKEEGISVELKTFKSAIDRDVALQSKNIDGAVSDILAVIFAKSGGFDVQIVSGTDGSYSLVGNGDVGEDYNGMKGKEVAVSKNTIIEYIADSIFAIKGLNERDINKVVVPQISARLELLQNKKLFAALLPEPLGRLAVLNGCNLITSSLDLNINPGIVVFRNDYLEKEKKKIIAFYRAYNKAVEYLNKSVQKDDIEFIVEKSAFPKGIKNDFILPKFNPAFLPTHKDFQETMNWVAKKGLSNKIYKYDELVNKEILQ